jgi:uncharacterized protein (TIGR03067 family)
MRRTLLLLAAVGLITGAGKKKTDQETVQGTWTVSSAYKNGKRLPAELVKRLKITFADNRFTLAVGAERKEATFTLDPKKKPHAITLYYGDGKTRPSRGIYRLRQGRLYLCFAEPGKARPDDFPEDNGKWQVYYLRRGS